MPMVDRVCHTCGWAKADIFEHGVPDRVDCPQGHATERVWIASGARGLALQDDSWPGGKTFENMGDKPMTFYSRSEHRRAMESLGLVEFVRHQPVAGTDKSPHTTSWASVSPYSLAEAKKLLERVTD